jgi:hypothetical protein
MRTCFAIAALISMILPAQAQQPAPPPANPPRVIQEPPLVPEPPETFGQGSRLPEARDRLNGSPGRVDSSPRNPNPPRDGASNPPR